MLWWKRIFGRSSTEDRAVELMNRGLKYVQDGRIKEAFSVADELHSLGYSGGYEIQAQALASQGSKDEAIAVLRQALEAAPESWLNASLLGNYLSDLGEYEEAFAVYDKALRTPTVDPILIEANYAMALKRAGREDEARRKLRMVMRRDLSQAEPDLQKFVRSLAQSLQVG